MCAGDYSFKFVLSLKWSCEKVCVCVRATSSFFFVNQCQGALSFLPSYFCAYQWTYFFFHLRSSSMFTFKAVMCSIAFFFSFVSLPFCEDDTSGICCHWQGFCEIRHKSLMLNSVYKIKHKHIFRLTISALYCSGLNDLYANTSRFSIWKCFNLRHFLTTMLMLNKQIIRMYNKLK